MRGGGLASDPFTRGGDPLVDGHVYRRGITKGRGKTAGV